MRFNFQNPNKQQWHRHFVFFPTYVGGTEYVLYEYVERIKGSVGWRFRKIGDTGEGHYDFNGNINVMAAAQIGFTVGYFFLLFFILVGLSKIF